MAREDKVRAVDRAFAETRLSVARAFLQQADISLQLVEGSLRNATVVSSAVLAGIAESFGDGCHPVVDRRMALARVECTKDSLTGRGSMGLDRPARLGQ
jgi:hypothetical protein